MKRGKEREKKEKRQKSGFVDGGRETKNERLLLVG